MTGGNRFMSRLSEIASGLVTPVERRLFAEYGAIFTTTATPPPRVMFADAATVNAFQATLSVGKSTIGEYPIELQAAALAALVRACEVASSQGLSITARAADAGRRTYEDTVGLWLRNVGRGLDHWLAAEKIDQRQAEFISGLSPVEQVGPILELEDQSQLYFGTFFDRSILYSVAAPGASQHLSMLAFDVAEYKDAQVEQILNAQGWFRSVVNDLPHFTYLGRQVDALPALGLKQVARQYGELTFNFWIPDL
jgi:hypothetical protein